MALGCGRGSRVRLRRRDAVLYLTPRKRGDRTGAGRGRRRFCFLLAEVPFVVEEIRRAPSLLSLLVAGERSVVASSSAEIVGKSAIGAGRAETVPVGSFFAGKHRAILAHGAGEQRTDGRFALIVDRLVLLLRFIRLALHARENVFRRRIVPNGRRASYKGLVAHGKFGFWNKRSGRLFLFLRNGGRRGFLAVRNVVSVVVARRFRLRFLRFRTVRGRLGIGNIVHRRIGITALRRGLFPAYAPRHGRRRSRLRRGGIAGSIGFLRGDRRLRGRILIHGGRALPRIEIGIVTENKVVAVSLLRVRSEENFSAPVLTLVLCREVRTRLGNRLRLGLTLLFAAHRFRLRRRAAHGRSKIFKRNGRLFRDRLAVFRSPLFFRAALFQMRPLDVIAERRFQKNEKYRKERQRRKNDVRARGGEKRFDRIDDDA